MNNKNHKKYKEMAQWLKGEYDTEYFDIKETYFDNPKKRWQIVFKKIYTTFLSPLWRGNYSKFGKGNYSKKVMLLHSSI